MTRSQAVRGNIGALMLAIVFTAPLVGRADEVTEAQAGLNQAYNDYYQALRQNPGFTQQKARELSDKYLSPAQARIAVVMDKDYQRARERFDAESATIRAKKKTVASAKGDSAGRAPAAATGSPMDAEAPIAAEKSEEPGLDGSNVPKEIEFPGPSSKAPAQAPGKTAAPAPRK